MLSKSPLAIFAAPQNTRWFRFERNKNFVKQKIILIIILSITAVMVMLVYNFAESDSAVENGGRITAGYAYELMQNSQNAVILDVRTNQEFEAEHIPGATLLPVNDIERLAKDMLPNKDELILIYCRTGQRSRTAAGVLVNLGYTNVLDFGGIVDWPFDTN